MTPTRTRQTPYVDLSAKGVRVAMARQLRPEELDFAANAPVRMVFARDAAAPPDRIFHALADDVEGWAEWFPSVTSIRPLDGGAGREVRLRGGIRFRETVLVAKSPGLYAYRVDTAGVPGVRALVEEWRLAPAGTGTRVQWTFATDGTAPFRAVVRLARPGLGKSFRDAVGALDRRLAAR